MNTTIPPDILRWSPPIWEGYLGNKRIKRYLKKTLKKLRRQMGSNAAVELNRLCFLLTGPSRTGKTAMVEFFVRCLGCRTLDLDTLNPCRGDCEYCREQPARDGVHGLEHLQRKDSWCDAKHVPHFVIVDCTRIYTPNELRAEVDSLRDYEGEGNIVVVYLDEVHRLVRRSMDEILLKTVEQMPFLWVLPTAKPSELEDMLKNRLLKFSTELPSQAELVGWLCDRCNEWGIQWESEAVVRVAERSNCVVGTALHALALASLDPEEGLTVELVEEDWELGTSD
jgi:DNA polymerase III gamma/tau subunit